MCVWGIEHSSFVRATSALSHWAISLSPEFVFSTVVTIIFEVLLLRIRLSPSELNKALGKDIITTRASSYKLAASSLLPVYDWYPDSGQWQSWCCQRSTNRIHPKHHFSEGSSVGFVHSITCPNQYIYTGGIPKKQKQSLSESILLCRRASRTKIHQSSRTAHPEKPHLALNPDSFNNTAHWYFHSRTCFPPNWDVDGTPVQHNGLFWSQPRCSLWSKNI